MGAGIAQICAAIGKRVILCDIEQEFVVNGLKTINRNLSRCYTNGSFVKLSFKLSLQKHLEDSANLVSAHKVVVAEEDEEMPVLTTNLDPRVTGTK